MVTEGNIKEVGGTNTFIKNTWRGGEKGKSNYLRLRRGRVCITMGKGKPNILCLIRAEE